MVLIEGELDFGRFGQSLRALDISARSASHFIPYRGWGAETEGDPDAELHVQIEVFQADSEEDSVQARTVYHPSFQAKRSAIDSRSFDSESEDDKHVFILDMHHIVSRRCLERHHCERFC